MALAHVTIGNEEALTLARDEAERRRLARALARVASSRMGLFGLADNHVHILVRCEYPALLARGLRRALQTLRPDLVLEAPHVRPVTTKAHLERVIPYILRQTTRHGLAGAGALPALWAGSSFLDIVRARVLPGWELTVLLEELPRMRQRVLHEAVGLDPVELAPADDEALKRAGAARLVELSAAVHAVGPVLVGRRQEVVDARALAARVGRDLGLRTEELAERLDLSARAVRYLATYPVASRAIHALRLRLALEQRVLAQRGLFVAGA